MDFVPRIIHWPTNAKACSVGKVRVNILTFILTLALSPESEFKKCLILLITIEVGAGEGNRTLRFDVTIDGFLE